MEILRITFRNNKNHASESCNCHDTKYDMRKNLKPPKSIYNQPESEYQGSKGDRTKEKPFWLPKSRPSVRINIDHTRQCATNNPIRNKCGPQEGNTSKNAA